MNERSKYPTLLKKSVGSGYDSTLLEDACKSVGCGYESTLDFAHEKSRRIV